MLFSSPLMLSIAYITVLVPPYAFLASLYLDGRELPERRVVVYTDPGAYDFSRETDGKVWFRHRLMQNLDGSTSEHVWVFKEKGIELLFDNLGLARAEDQQEGIDEDELANAFQSSRLKAVQEKSKVGSIQVDVRRVILGRVHHDRNHRIYFKEGQDEGVDMNGVQGEITHAAGLVRGKPIAPNSVQVIDYTPYKPEEGIYATFKFFYRSRGTSPVRNAFQHWYSMVMPAYIPSPICLRLVLLLGNKAERICRATSNLRISQFPSAAKDTTTGHTLPKHSYGYINPIKYLEAGGVLIKKSNRETRII